jgi:hypothetical protein
MILLYHFWAFIQRNVSLHTIEIPAHMFIAALFTIAKLWKQPRYPSNKENVVHMHNKVLFNSKEEQNYTICLKVDRSGDHHVK